MIDVGLPRAVASRVTVQSLAVTQRVIAVVGSLLATTVVIDVQVNRGVPDALGLQVAPILGIGVLALLLIWRPGVMTAIIYLAGGAVLSVATPVIGLAVDPTFDESGAYLINRVATALCLVGAVGSSAISGLLWSTIAFVVAQASVVVGLSLSGSSSVAGTGPLLVFGISFVTYLTLALARRESERQLSPIRAAELEVRTLDDRRALERRAAGILHDTLLADLTAISQYSGPLNQRMRTVLTEHSRLVDEATVATTTVDEAPQRSALSDALLSLVKEYQWSGVRVDVSGVESLEEHVDAEVLAALIGAVRASLDNVVRHAGTDRAELVVGIRNRHLTILVVDDGAGFDAAGITSDRLGVRESIVGRVEQAGGSVRLWSGPDGTTVMMTVPLAGGLP